MQLLGSPSCSPYTTAVMQQMQNVLLTLKKQWKCLIQPCLKQPDFDASNSSWLADVQCRLLICLVRLAAS